MDPTSSRALNADRIRRHMARSTPDVIQHRFSGLDDQQVADNWLKHFLDHMKIKYGTNVRVDVYREETLGYLRGQLFTARVVKDK